MGRLCTILALTFLHAADWRGPLQRAGCRSRAARPAEAGLANGFPIGAGFRCAISALLILVLTGCAGGAETVRFATFNSALSKDAPGELLETMRTPDDAQAKAVAAVIQAARPDVLLLQEFDHGGEYDPDGEALRLFQQNYLAKPQGEGLGPIQYEHVYLAPSNTGIPTGVDLNNDGLVAPTDGAELGTTAYAADAHGYGLFPGQYAFVVLSKYPIDRESIRTFGEFLWKDLPGNHLPTDYYSDEAKDVLRLSSKNHVDVPVKVGDHTIHVLASHPTPPVFDGPENRNGRRNYDEIGLWVLLFQASQAGETSRVADDAGNDRPFLNKRYSGFPIPFAIPQPIYTPYVFLGDMNADPLDGEQYRVNDSSAIWQLFRSQLPVLGTSVSTSGESWDVQASPGGADAVKRDGGINAGHRTSPELDTADWHDHGEDAPGNLRVDYALPSPKLKGIGGGVLWPTADQPLMGVDLDTVECASDHRLVWVDVRVE